MSMSTKILHEIKAMGAATLFFGAWIGALFVLKGLVLAEYEIAPRGVATAVVGVLVLAKVVLILEHVPLGRWIRGRPAWVDLFLRTGLYTAGVFVAMLLERSLHERHEAGGWLPAVAAAFRDSNRDHVLANTLVVFGALLVFNASAVLRAHLGGRALLGLFREPLPEQPEGDA